MPRRRGCSERTSGGGYRASTWAPAPRRASATFLLVGADESGTLRSGSSSCPPICGASAMSTIARFVIATALASLVGTSTVRADFPARMKAGEIELTLNGAGGRTKYLMQMYEAGLYLSHPSNDG